ncbi:MAG: phosphomannomutase/phosphoglucomutase, partial [Actinomycetes bacterium]
MTIDLGTIIKAYDVRGTVPDQLSPDVARAIGAAFARVVALPEGARRVVIGHDMRDSGPALVEAFTRGVTGEGVDVVRIGLCSTDGLYHASGTLDAPGAMFTASHNPAVYNGIKLCRAGARPVGQDTGLAEVRELAQELLDAPSVEPVETTNSSVEPVETTNRVSTSSTSDGGVSTGSTSEQDTLGDYAAFLRGLVDLSGIRPLKVVVDAGNGMAGYTVPAVLGTGAGLPVLPLDVVDLYFELDGTFPNHEANPIEPENMRDLQAKVVEVGADVGLAFDGDADRCFLVDERGGIVSPSVLTALIAARELRREPGATVIHNLITSRAVPEIVTELGGTPVRTRVGHSFIKATMADSGAIFGGEHSGHFYFRDFWRADSGMLAALH